MWPPALHITVQALRYDHIVASPDECSYFSLEEILASRDLASKKRRESFAPRPSSPPVVVQNFSLSSARESQAEQIRQAWQISGGVHPLEKKPRARCKKGTLGGATTSNKKQAPNREG